MTEVLTGLDVLRNEAWPRLKGHRLGLLSNQASIDRGFIPAKKIIADLLPGHLKALFGPQHGYDGVDQDNMIETGHSIDRDMNIPIFSLYSQVREPSVEMLDLIDFLIIDLQDIGTRVYTFVSTMLGCLRAAAKMGKKVIILDRPNPLGGEILEGNLLKPELYSFVGPYRFPMRHGLTMGEMAQIFNDAYGLRSDIEVVCMKQWTRRMIWPDTGLRWIMPSPNMPLPETAQVYPGQVVWEGTNISEGRGTCRPFETFGAPFLDTRAVLDRLIPQAHAGCVLQEVSFRPTFNKWMGQVCRGFMIHVTDPLAYRPYFTTLALLKAVMETHGQSFAWKEPPYEYEFERLAIDLILGDEALRKELEVGADLTHWPERWDEELKDFVALRKSYLLYA
jgi:uncharacterized protein YbbC (DUF1343 family)